MNTSSENFSTIGSEIATDLIASSPLESIPVLSLLTSNLEVKFTDSSASKSRSLPTVRRFADSARRIAALAETNARFLW